MAEESLTGLKIKDTYEGLLHVSDGGISGNSGEAAVTKVYDGIGKSTCLEIAKDYLKVIGAGKFENALGDPLLQVNANGNVGIGDLNVTAGGAQLAIKGNGTTTWGSIAVTSSNDGDWGFIDQGVEGKGIGLRGFGFQNGTLECDLYVNGEGRVGIGTETPGSMLEIKGDGSTKWGGIEIDTNGDGGSGFIDQGVDGRGIGLRGESVQNGTLECDLYVANDGKVGIGTETPQKKLHIVGQMRYEHGTPQVGQVLTCANTNGNVEWQEPGTGGVSSSIIIKYADNSSLGGGSASTWEIDPVVDIAVDGVAGVSVSPDNLTVILPNGTYRYAFIYTSTNTTYTDDRDYRTQLAIRAGARQLLTSNSWSYSGTASEQGTINVTSGGIIFEGMRYNSMANVYGAYLMLIPTADFTSQVSIEAARPELLSKIQ